MAGEKRKTLRSLRYYSLEDIDVAVLQDIYKKELDFKISTSYGPGRYDREYEDKGHDYPYAYVRWTENRNMTEYLKMVHEINKRVYWTLKMLGLQ